MERYRQIYQEMVSLLRDSEAIDTKMLDYRLFFETKIFGLEMMHRNTLEQIKELEQVFKRETEDRKTILSEIDNTWNKAIAFFEAYLNAFYSLLQLIGKITSCFYQKEKAKLEAKMAKQFDKNFGTLIGILKSHSNIDPAFSSYLKTNLGWYETLRNNRHKITHEWSAFLGFTRDGKTLFLDYPNHKEEFSYPSKPTKDLEDYLNQNLDALFNFMDFYVKHFRQLLTNYSCQHS
jgi:hypothetical protein